MLLLKAFSELQKHVTNDMKTVHDIVALDIDCRMGYIRTTLQLAANIFSGGFYLWGWHFLVMSLGFVNDLTLGV